MATSDQVRRLIDSHERGDERSFRQTVNDMADEARRSQQDTLAFDLESLISDRSSGSRPIAVGNLRPLPLGRDDLPLVTLHEPNATFADLVLAPPLVALLEDIIKEHRHRDLLAARGLQPRKRLLFSGPSGTGKSKTAEAIAAALGVPVARVRLAAVVSSYLGETAKHLEQIMEFAAYGTWVLVFDEFDMLALDRDRDDHGEMRRVVAAFLQTLEEAASTNLVIATTNHPRGLDSAMWRRFDEIAVFAHPTKRQVEQLLAVKLRRMPSKRINRSTVAASLTGMTQAEIEMVCLDAMRAGTLAGRSMLTTEDLVTFARERRRRLQEAGRSLT